MAWPITRADVEGHLGVSPASDRDVIHLDRVTAAVVSWVERNVVVDDLGHGAEHELGAILLAARLYARRGSPLGVAAFAELGAAYVSRHDPDVERLLGLGKPKVG